jgi:hypothetical protein
MGGDLDITTRLEIPRSRYIDCTRGCVDVKTAGSEAAIPQRKAAKSICPSVLLDLGIDEMT